jgi:hypothetical protein
MKNRMQDREFPNAISGLAAKLRKGFLRSLVGSLVLAAAMGIYAFVVGQWGETELRILLTTLSVSFCSMTAMASAAAFSRGRDFPLAYGLSIAGVAMSIVAFLLFIGAIWSHSDFNEPYAKTMAIAGILAFSLGHACLLGLASLPRHLRWVYWLTLCAIAALATAGSGMIVFEADDEVYFRILGIIGILDGCGTLTTPILAKLHGVPCAAVRYPGAVNEVTLFCPQCGRRETHPLGDVTCSNCGLKLHLALLKKED